MPKAVSFLQYQCFSPDFASQESSLRTRHSEVHEAQTEHSPLHTSAA